jgi:hypothetical protein
MANFKFIQISACESGVVALDIDGIVWHHVGTFETGHWEQARMTRVFPEFDVEQEEEE